jgi:hypothetical protein
VGSGSGSRVSIELTQTGLEKPSTRWQGNACTGDGSALGSKKGGDGWGMEDSGPRIQQNVGRGEEGVGKEGTRHVAYSYKGTDPGRNFVRVNTNHVVP